MNIKKILAVIAGILGACFVYLGISMKIKEQESIAIIGGADGPTAIFVAGKVGDGTMIAIAVVGVILILGAIWLFRKRIR